MLFYIINEIYSMDKNHRIYLITFIIEFNTKIKKMKSINDLKIRCYLLYLIYKDYKDRIEIHLKNKYNIDIVTRLINFINAKIQGVQHLVAFKILLLL
jgi:hypothetical protein